jgi:hypothetical protein
LVNVVAPYFASADIEQSQGPFGIAGILWTAQSLSCFRQPATRQAAHWQPSVIGSTSLTHFSMYSFSDDMTRLLFSQVYCVDDCASDALHKRGKLPAADVLAGMLRPV